ncbi:MAG: hypothetical protein AAB288_02070 [Acidobacteriota bacterium]
METVEQARETILKELTSDDSEVREEYLKTFDGDAKAFAEFMAQAFVKWRDFDNDIKDDEKRAHVSALVYVAITLHVLSMKLFLSGHTVAAGNLFRQVIESIALALLCSGKDFDVLKRFMKNKYSSNDAVRDVLRHYEKLSLKGDALEALKESQEFYHKYSHVTKMTIAAGMSFSKQGGLYVGASFDDGKLDAYKKEIHGRVGLAKVFPNFVTAVTDNVAKW